LVAIVDVPSRLVVGHLEITAQDPRAIAVRGERLYVVPFESGNQTQLSGCFGAESIDGDRCTFDFIEQVVVNNNVLSLGYDADIVRDPRLPDRDLFVFDTRTDQLVEAVSTIGTLLYGVTADSKGRVFIAQTEARNDANGRAGTLKQTLVDLENRAFLNQIAVVDCSTATCASPRPIELEPLPPEDPAPGTALATPFGIQISGDDSTLVVTAAGSHRLFTVDAADGRVLGRVEVGWVPRGVALQSAADGSPRRAWVLNAVANSVSVVDVSSPTHPRVLRTVPLEDPTHPEVKLGRFAFNNADASSTGTFSCESCHPDGNTDQLLWSSAVPSAKCPAATRSLPAARCRSAACATPRPITGTVSQAIRSAASTVNIQIASFRRTAPTRRAARVTCSTALLRGRCATRRAVLRTRRESRACSPRRSAMPWPCFS
jgi:hypothetical protein